MSALVLATQRTAQPQGAAPIDWGNPLTRGLSFSLSGVDGRDRVSGGAITRTASLSTGVTRHGFGFSSAANSAFSRSLDLSGTSEITVSFVLVLRDSTIAVMVEHTANYNTTPGGCLIYADAGNFFAGVGSGAGVYNVSQCAAPALNTTVRVVVTLRRIGTSAKACRIWFDGVEQATTQPYNGAISGNLANSTTYFLGRGASSLFANSIIQDPAIFSRALSDGEIATLSRNPWQLFRPVGRRIWVPVSTGGPVTVELASSTASLDSSETTVYQNPVALNLNNATYGSLFRPIEIESFTGLSLTSSGLNVKSETTGAKKTLFTTTATQSAFSQVISIITDAVVPLETALIKTSSLPIQLPVVLSLDDAINQVVFNKLKSLGYSGTVQDMLSVFFGGTGTLPDRENLWLVSKTGSTGPSIDLWKKHLNGLGYSGAVAEMLKQFWINY